MVASLLLECSRKNCSTWSRVQCSRAVDAGVDYQTNRAEHLVVETSVVLVRILIEPDLLTQPFRIERPAFLEGRVARLLAERRQIRKLLRNRDLPVMARNSLVIRSRLVVDRQLVREA